MEAIEFGVRNVRGRAAQSRTRVRPPAGGAASGAGGWRVLARSSGVPFKVKQTKTNQNKVKQTKKNTSWRQTVFFTGDGAGWKPALLWADFGNFGIYFFGEADERAGSETGAPFAAGLAWSRSVTVNHAFFYFSGGDCSAGCGDLGRAFSARILGCCYPGLRSHARFSPGCHMAGFQPWGTAGSPEHYFVVVTRVGARRRHDHATA